VTVITDGTNNWIVADWDRVPNFSNAAEQNSFQVWIGLTATQDITFTYGPELTAGEGGALTVGAENFLGNSGQNAYFSDGTTTTGTLPTSTTELAVSGSAGAPGETKTITITAKANQLGKWRNCAKMETDAVFGEAMSCVQGETVKP
jgi:hypothetical protein